jgi:polyphosphate kinase
VGQTDVGSAPRPDGHADPLMSPPTGSNPSTAPDAPSYADELAEALAEEATEPPRREDDTLPRDRFLDREASWLDFNARVLALAEDPDVPLLERVRFLAIFATNLDEFFMVRVAGLKRRLATGIAVTSPAGLEPREQLAAVSARAHELVEQHAATYHDVVSPELAQHGIEIVRWDDLDGDERRRMQTLFTERVAPVLTPLAVDPAHPFPYISGLSLNLAVVVRDRDTGREHFARVKVPPLLPRFLPLGEGRFTALEGVIAAHLPELFAGMEVLETHTFRVTRNEDLEVEDAEAEDLLQALERELVRRRFGPPVRLEIEDSVSDYVLDLLVRELDMDPGDVYRLPAPLDLSGLWAIADLDRTALKYPAFVPTTHPALRDAEGKKAADFFAAIREKDVLLHHPYDSFSTSVQAFVEQAATDPRVLAIKQTLYRTSGDSPIVDALIDAATAGKQVLVLVEIKARFDEQANIRWARALEQAGCHVVYGLVGLKTHCKLSLVVREEKDGRLMRYAHIGTGNYHPKTARLYEDLGLLTADQEVGEDVADLFNHLSGYTKHRDFEALLVAPDTLRTGLTERIRAETENARAGRDAGVTLKLNSLVDEEIVDALYEASQAGVPVDLVVRGICALRPGVPGLSETVRVRSILGRFLEHSRIFRFRNDRGDGADDEEYWIGSADVMHRNLDRRIEALVQVRDPRLRVQLAALCARALSAKTGAWELHPDGVWTRSDGEDYQAELARSHPTAVPDDPKG